MKFGSFIHPGLLVVKLAFRALLFFATYRGLTRQKTEGGMAFTAVLLVFIANFQRELRIVHVPIEFNALGFTVYPGTVATVVSLLIITVMLLIRFFRSQREKELWKLEIERAQHVQQILIPNKLPEVQGLSIDSEYRPAREVGDDFFRCCPARRPAPSSSWWVTLPERACRPACWWPSSSAPFARPARTAPTPCRSCTS